MAVLVTTFHATCLWNIKFNRVLKDAVHNLGANKASNTLSKIGKVVGILDDVMRNFDDDHCIKLQSGKHRVADFKKEMDSVVKVLMSEDLLVPKCKRLHDTFINVKSNSFQNINIL